MKTCGRCRESLPENEFGKRKLSRDGLQAFCRKCLAEYQTSYRKIRRNEPQEDPMKTKVCSRCGEGKPSTLEHFSPDRQNRDGLSYTCKKCCVIAAQKKYYADPEQARARGRDWSFKKSLKKLGMTLEDFNNLLETQGGRCAICGTDSPHGRTDRFVVDHDHKTGLPRGLLCSVCNVAIGLLQDDPAILERATDYLRQWQGRLDVERHGS